MAKRFRLFGGEANFFKLVLSHPCATPWFVYWETFLPAAIKLAITIATMDLTDLAQDRLKSLPKGGGIGRAASRARGRSHLTRNSFAEPEDDVRGRTFKQGQRFTESAFEEKKFVQGFTKGLSIISGPLETIGFFWLLYSSVDQFFYDWSSLLQRRDFCNSDPDTGPFQAHSNATDTIWPMDGTPLSWQFVDQNRGGWPQDFFSVAPGAGTYEVFCSLTTTSSATANAPHVFLRLNVLLNGVLNLHFDSDVVPLQPGQAVDVVGHWTVPAFAAVGVSFSFEGYSTDAPVGVASMSGLRFAVYRADWFRGLLPNGWFNPSL